MKTTTSNDMITDEQSLDGAELHGSPIKVYDDGYGPLWVHRDSMGISGIVRASSWEDAYSICEDEFFPDCDLSMEEIVKEYGFKREYRKAIRRDMSTPFTGPQPSGRLGPNEKFAEASDCSDNGKLPDGAFLRWITIETPDPEAWADNALFQEAYGFRPNAGNGSGIYCKDLNGDRLDLLTPELANELGITLAISNVE